MYEFNIALVKEQSNLKSQKNLTLKKISGNIKTIHLFHNGALLHGIRFFDAKNTCVYESAWKSAFTGYAKHEITLAEGEKIVGFESRCVPGSAWH